MIASTLVTGTLCSIFVCRAHSRKLESHIRTTRIRGLQFSVCAAVEIRRGGAKGGRCLHPDPPVHDPHITRASQHFQNGQQADVWDNQPTDQAG